MGNCTRKQCEKYPGILTVRLCAECHRRIHDTDKSTLQRQAQKELEKIMSHEDYMKEFKKNYL